MDTAVEGGRVRRSLSGGLGLTALECHTGGRRISLRKEEAVDLVVDEEEPEVFCVVEDKNPVRLAYVGKRFGGHESNFEGVWDVLEHLILVSVVGSGLSLV